MLELAGSRVARTMTGAARIVRRLVEYILTVMVYNDQQGLGMRRIF